MHNIQMQNCWFSKDRDVMNMIAGLLTEYLNELL